MKNIKEILNVFLTGVVLIFILYFTLKTLNPLIEQIQNQSIAKGDVIGIMAILLTFISISAFGVYYVVSKAQESRLDKLSNELHDLAHDARVASSASGDMATALSFMYSHIYFYSEEGRMEKLLEKSEHEESKFIKSAILFGKIAKNKIDGIKDRDLRDRLLFKAENNLSFAFALSFFPSEQDKTEADKLSRKVCNFSKDHNFDWINKYVPAATRAVVLLRFTETDAEAEKRKEIADEIYESLLNENRFRNKPIFDVPDNQRNEIIYNKEFVARIIKLKAAQ